MYKQAPAKKNYLRGHLAIYLDSNFDHSLDHGPLWSTKVHNLDWPDARKGRSFVKKTLIHFVKVLSRNRSCSQEPRSLLGALTSNDGNHLIHARPRSRFRILGLWVTFAGGLWVEGVRQRYRQRRDISGGANVARKWRGKE